MNLRLASQPNQVKHQQIQQQQQQHQLLLPSSIKQPQFKAQTWINSSPLSLSNPKVNIQQQQQPHYLTQNYNSAAAATPLQSVSSNNFFSKKKQQLNQVSSNSKQAATSSSLKDYTQLETLASWSGFNSGRLQQMDLMPNLTKQYTVIDNASPHQNHFKQQQPPQQPYFAEQSPNLTLKDYFNEQQQQQQQQFDHESKRKKNSRSVLPLTKKQKQKRDEQQSLEGTSKAAADSDGMMYEFGSQEQEAQQKAIDQLGMNTQSSQQQQFINLSGLMGSIKPMEYLSATHASSFFPQTADMNQAIMKQPQQQYQFSQTKSHSQSQKAFQIKRAHPNPSQSSLSSSSSSTTKKLSDLKIKEKQQQQQEQYQMKQLQQHQQYFQTHMSSSSASSSTPSGQIFRDKAVRTAASGQHTQQLENGQTDGQKKLMPIFALNFPKTLETRVILNNIGV